MLLVFLFESTGVGFPLASSGRAPFNL
jgi:hypothetical protein